MSVTVSNGKVEAVQGHKCSKGEAYAVAETERPSRILTSTVLAEGMEIKAVPVRTSAPIPKKLMFEAMKSIRRLKVTRPVREGEVVLENIAGTGADLIATRECRGR